MYLMSKKRVAVDTVTPAWYCIGIHGHVVFSKIRFYNLTNRVELSIRLS